MHLADSEDLRAAFIATARTWVDNVRSNPEMLAMRNGSTPIIMIDPGKDAEVHFSDVSTARTGNWRLRFDNRGRLTKAELDTVDPLKTRVVPMSSEIPSIQPE